MNETEMEHMVSVVRTDSANKYNIRIRFWAERNSFSENHFLIYWRDTEPNMKSHPSYRRAVISPIWQKDGSRDVGAVVLETSQNDFWYVFRIKPKSSKDDKWLGSEGLKEELAQAKCFHFSVQSPIFQTCPKEESKQLLACHLPDRTPLEPPSWLEGITVYQIFPDRFFCGDKLKPITEARLEWEMRPHRSSHRQHDCQAASVDGEMRPHRSSHPDFNLEIAGGDLLGTKEKLDYLKELGVGACYINPLFKSPSNHKYDTQDYYNVDPAFGTNDDLVDFVKEAHARDIRVILDGVFNHCSNKLEQFRDVLNNGLNSQYISWFNFTDQPSDDTEKWDFETFAQLEHMPKFNLMNDSCQKYLLDVAAHWTHEADIDGWRLDAAEQVPHEFWKKFRKRLKAIKSDIWILGEVCNDNNYSDCLGGDEFDSITNMKLSGTILKFLEGRSKPSDFEEELKTILYKFNPVVSSQLLNMIGNHDMMRVEFTT